ncbi:alpha beta-hydrolase [Trichoderma arundinaceum]|uniref:Alpha beta-hydrolase n=1 Tax=Trichoderma arundinaceum TaxID=490622 RepID=A0A395NE28_TRIAR|nr:alpha beta-hydrolase [Trichoderma arundinaceum]
MEQTSIIFTVIVSLLTISLLYDKVTKGIPTRLVAEEAPKARFGLVPVGTHKSPAPARGTDIIFIHGLGSNPDTTWRARLGATTSETSERYVTWVSDFLPDDLCSDDRRDIRLFFYNYDAYWKRDALPERLSTLGAALVNRITSGIRTTDAERSRDLIFVAHSYGGLVVKKALLLATANRSQNNVVESTKAILFLGTPHRGSSFSVWGRWQAQALWLLGSNPSILADLYYDSASLRDLHDEFARIDQENIKVYNFYEQRPLLLAQLWFFKWQEYCVHESSATYAGPRVHNIGLSVDHYGLNKFGSRDVNYEFVLSKLREVTLSKPVLMKCSYVVPLETVESYTQREELWKQLDDKMRIRHDKASVPYAVAISGMGGAGKSQLALKFAEAYKDRYNLILWIDATDTESIRSSFQRFAAELQLPENWDAKRESLLTDDGAIQAVLRWLRDRSEADGEWLVIVDNADDFSSGIQKVIPKGERGSVLITSQDALSVKLIPWGCEHIVVEEMAPHESTKLLLHHLGQDVDTAPENVTAKCRQLADQLGNLALALDLAGAYIENEPDPKSALVQYLEDFTRHSEELLQMDGFRGLLPSQKTVWTVWDATLEKIARDHQQLNPYVLLMFLAHFQGTIIQDELLRLAAFGIPRIQSTIGEDLPTELQEFLSTNEGNWDSFRYRKSRDVMLRYSLLKRAVGKWPGITLHGLIQWRALRRITKEKIPQWNRWFLMVIVAACSQMIKERHQPEFRRHLVTHLLQISELYDKTSGLSETHKLFIQGMVAKIYYDEGRWDEAEKLDVEVMEAYKAKLGADHPDTLRSIASLASTLWNQGRWDKSEKLQVEVIEACKAKLGADHPDTLRSIANLASTLWKQGRWDESEKLDVEVIEARKAKLGADHPDTLRSIANLAAIFYNQGRWDESEKLQVEVMEAYKAKLGDDHPDTLGSIANLASTLWKQGRWDEAEKLKVEVMEAYKAKLGADHPDTLRSIANLATTFNNQGRWDESEKLQVEVIEAYKAKLGADHPDTLRSIANLATIFYDQGRWDEAEKLEVEVMEAYKAKLGADHPDTLISMSNLAITWRTQGRHDEAFILMRDCIQACERVLGSRHPHTLSSLAILKEWD